MGRSRLEEITCAICYDSLFTKKDDLQDTVPVATSDCGHVFHEPCLLKWFQTQSDQYLASERDRRIDGRDGSPSLSDAPAECPSCRKECYADPETGQPLIHRLFIDFEGLHEGDSSFIGSSPPSSSSRRSAKGKEKEKEVLDLARRAKGISAETRGLNADSSDDNMTGMLGRGEGLVQDLVGAKTLTTLQNYIAALQNDLKALRNTLITNPLIPTLRAQIVDRERELVNLNRQSRLTIEREIKKVKEEEQGRCERRVKKAEDDRSIFQREYEKEKVHRKAGMQAMKEREEQYVRQLEEATKLLEKEKESRTSLQATLNDRNKQLKLLQKRVEDRKDLKSQLAALLAENARLKSARNHSSSTQRSQYSDAEDDNGETSVQEISGSLFPSSSQAGPSRSRHSKEEDESLQIDMPSFYDDSLRSPSRLLPSKTTMKHLNSSGLDLSPSKSTRAGHQRMHPTARTITFDMDEDSKKSRRRSTSSKYFPSEINDKENIITHSREAEGKSGKVLVSASPESTVKKVRDGPSPPKRSKTNPFITNKASVEKRKELPSAAKLSDTPFANLSRGMPGRITPTGSRQSIRTGGTWEDKSIIDLANSSPEASPKRPVLPKRNQTSSAILLGLADANGRPKLGNVNGPKVRRR